MSYKLKTPCANCPFRCDIPGYLHRERAVEIAESIAYGATFPCHKTTVESPDDDGEMVAAEHSQFCAGALIMMEHMDSPNQIVRVAETIGMYDKDRVDMSAPVVHSYMEFVDHHSPADFEDNTCHISGQGCESPAGYMVGNTPIYGPDLGYELRYCEGCGERTCDTCFEDGDDNNSLCPYCADEEA